MKVLSRLLILCFILLPLEALAIPSLIITNDPGGSLDERYDIWVHIREKNQKVVIDGLCISACAMLTGLIPKDRVCITPRAVIGVHSAFTITRSPGGPVRSYDQDGTLTYWYTLSPELRELLKERGWDGTTEQKTLIMFDYSALKNIYRDCQED